MNRHIYTVGQVNRYIRNLFARDGFLGGILVCGEVSNCKYHTSGHIYFSLKDDRSSLSCVMFAGKRSGLDFRMKDGDRVVVSGNVDTYERDGRYQLYASSIRLEGMGELYARFLKLKQELEEQGLFDPAYKKKIPPYAMTVGVVTAKGGAAVRDIENITRRRNPYVQLILCPAYVQGDLAPASIARGLRVIDSLGVDVLIVGRGGGSYEDLQAFNTEEVARAIFACRTPVISAVGHETDTTISDYAADLRAPTPSAAAELAVFDYAEFESRVSAAGSRLTRAALLAVERAEAECARRRSRLQLLSPSAKLLERRHEEREYTQRLESAFLSALARAERRTEEIGRRLEGGAFAALADARTRQRMLIERMKGLNPLDRLNQGYSYVEDPGGKALRSIAQAETGDMLKIWVTDGILSTEVKAKNERKY